MCSRGTGQIDLLCPYRDTHMFAVFVQDKCLAVDRVRIPLDHELFSAFIVPALDPSPGIKWYRVVASEGVSHGFLGLNEMKVH